MSEVFFVGCGPGDPDLITVKAKKLIQKADVVVYSGSLIPDPILKLCKKGKLHDAAKLVREEIFDLLYKNAKKDKLVVRLHDGDPSIYGAIKEQIDNLEKKGIKSTVVPGVTAFLASAAALGTQLTLPGVTQTIIVTRAESRTKVPKREKISELAKHKATLIFYLSIHLLSKLSKEAIAGGGPCLAPLPARWRPGNPQARRGGSGGWDRPRARASCDSRSKVLRLFSCSVSWDRWPDWGWIPVDWSRCTR